jgi:hypothetical protein
MYFQKKIFENFKSENYKILKNNVTSVKDAKVPQQ